MVKKAVTPATTAVTTPPVPKKVNYLNNKDLLQAVKDSKKIGRMNDKLAKMLLLLCAKYAKKGNFVNYTYNDDMQGYAMLMLVRTWNSFNSEVYTNAFAFYTQCIKNSFIQFLKYEKRHRTIRDLLLIDQGMNPSFNFQDESSDGHYVEDEEDFHTQRKLADNLFASLDSEALAPDDDTLPDSESTPPDPIDAAS